jgi:carbon starvation protein
VIGYGFVAAILPVWLLLARATTFRPSSSSASSSCSRLRSACCSPRSDAGDHALHRRHGPIFSGKLFPFLFITLACGAISGFHALVSSGTTPKLIARETDVRMMGYGSMALESFVGSWR